LSHEALLNNILNILKRESLSRKYPSPDECLAGTFLGFGVAMVLIVVAAYIGAAPPFADVFPTMLGGMVAGYMVARRVAHNHLIIGLLIGVGSFFMSTLFVLLIFKTITGLLWMWVGFLVGGAVGGALSAAVHSKTHGKLINKKPANSL